MSASSRIHVHARTFAALITCVLASVAVPSAGAAPLACGEVITKDTTLQSDLTNCPGDGLVVGADEITLDLNELGQTLDHLQVHTLDGNDTVTVDPNVNTLIGVAVDLGLGQI